MVLKCLGSGSSGNCYILENNNEALVIEAGLPFMEVKKSLKFNTKKIVGVLVSHVHTDHSKYIHEYEKAGIPIWKFDYFSVEKNRIMGHYRISMFDLVHDVPCYGFYISHPEIGSLVYASDTEYIEYRFPNINHILVECNYDRQLISTEAYNRSRVLQTHMEIQTTKEFIKVNNNSSLKTVLLLHLSSKNSNAEAFANEIQSLVECPVYVAEKGLVIELGGMTYQ